MNKRAIRITGIALGLALGLGWPLLAAEPFVKTSEDRARIEQALPQQAMARPSKPRRLLIFTLNVGYGGHPSMAYANEAFTLMGRKTGAFETVVTDDPAVFEAASLKTFDAVFFNNNVGNCFTNSQSRQNLLEFITGGGGLLGVHGTTVAFTRWPGAFEDWPEFGFLIGARGANHKDSNEHVWIKLDEPDHPINRVFGGQGFAYRDEFFRPQDPYSRQRVRVLLSIDTTKTDVTQGQPRGNCLRTDNDYAVAWVRNYGRGRIFYCTIAHNPYVFWDSKMLQFYLAALQFALGDLPAPTIPSAKLTPALRAEENLGWRAGLEPGRSSELTFSELIEESARLGLPFVGGSTSQRVGEDLAKNLDPRLTNEELSQVRLKLERGGLRLVTCRVERMPEDETACRKLFEFGRKLGIETFEAAPAAGDLDRIEKLCEEYDINVALCHPEQGPGPDYSTPEAVLKACRGHSLRLGACADLAAWKRLGIDPRQAVRKLKNRLLTVRMDAGSASAEPRQDFAPLLADLQQLGLRPAIFGFAFDGTTRTAAMTDIFHQTCLKLEADVKTSGALKR